MFILRLVAISILASYSNPNIPIRSACSIDSIQVIPAFETQVEYVIKAAKKIQSDRIKSMDVKEDIATSLQRYIDNWHEGGVWSGDCKSWYKNNTKDGKIMCWGGSVSDVILCPPILNTVPGNSCG